MTVRWKPLLILFGLFLVIALMGVTAMVLVLGLIMMAILNNAFANPESYTYLRSAIARGQAKPMVVVMPYGHIPREIKVISHRTPAQGWR